MPSVSASVYHVEAVVWTGEVAEICRASRRDGRVVALKRVRRDIKGRRTALRSLHHEASIGLQLEHPNVVRTLRYVADPDGPVMVMEYFPSRNAKVRLLNPRGDPLLTYHTTDLLCQMADALCHLHERGFIHMDLKPENYLVSDEGLVKLTDFAITQRVAAGWRRLIPTRRRISGTRPYIAPETLRRRAPDFRTDIYSFGATLYETLTKRPPFSSVDRNELLAMHLHQQPTAPRIYNKNLTPEIEALILRMLEKDPGRRPQNMNEVAVRLERTPIFVEPPTKPPPQEVVR